MQVELVTKKDLEEFRSRLLVDLNELIERGEKKREKLWLKNKDVKELLGISSSTVQRLRITGQLKSVKIGGVHYYSYAEIEKMINRA